MITSLISPRVGLGIIKREIEKQANVNVKHFEILYHKKFDNLKFIITQDDKPDKLELKYYDEGDKLSTLINTMIRTQLDEDISIDGFKIETENKQIKASVFYINPKGEKESQTIIL